ncbi:DNA-binding response regulator [Lachnotalea glycerini]|nr:DNA-binding response regulator [Lachnotalea glycerini]
MEEIKIIDDMQPDINFVDIRMPFMDGIEFSKLAMKRYPNLKIIILSAFSDFEYARQCIGIGVCDYLLKPIVKSDIQKNLIKIVEQLDHDPRQTQNEINKTIFNENTNIQNIKKYIMKNYANANINLTSIAQYFGFNPSYLSRMFKSETGISMIDYITSIRMEKAMQYAAKGILMYRTAKLVGIPDPNYFGKCFKKYTDYVYSDYIKQAKENGI